MNWRRLAALAVFVLAAAAPGRAQTPRAPGPAIWAVSSGANTVYILGTPSVAPKGMAWDSAVLDARLKGANSLILPATPKIDAIKMPRFVLTYEKSFEEAGPMETTLPAPLRARFVAARTRLGQDAGHYGKWRPGVAALILANDFRKKGNLAANEAEKRAKDLASRNGTPQVHVAPFDVMPLFQGYTTLPETTHQDCLADALADVDAGSARIVAASQGWARGDVRAAMTAENGFRRCLAEVPGGVAFADRLTADIVAAISAALARPGHSVAVVQLRGLLDKGGVLDRLRAKGFTVTGPG